MAEARKVGDPFADGIQQGPQIDERQFKKIQDLIASGKKESVTGGGKWGDKGESVFVLVLPVSKRYLENRHIVLIPNISLFFKRLLYSTHCFLRCSRQYEDRTRGDFWPSAKHF